MKDAKRIGLKTKFVNCCLGFHSNDWKCVRKKEQICLKCKDIKINPSSISAPSIWDIIELACLQGMDLYCKSVKFSAIYASGSN